MFLIGEGDRLIAGMPRPEPTVEDERFMLRALELAEGGRGRTSPNPLVGAVVVKEGRVIGEGFHEKVGGPHAEVNALRAAGKKAMGATLYVTLEPCNHHGKTPPCTDAVTEAGVSRVVIAMKDENANVSGGGAEILAEAGIEVSMGIYREIAGRQNEAYLKVVRTGFPFVTVKMATSLDGKSATKAGDSKWISGSDARREVHVMRSAADVVMVGAGTVLADDPMLTARDVGAERQPLRVVVDGEAVTPPGSMVADTAEAPTLVAAAPGAAAEKVEALRKVGVDCLVSGEGAEVDLEALMVELSRRGLSSVLVEGGAGLVGRLVDAGLVDKLVFYIAPLLTGGKEAPGPVGGAGVEKMMDARGLEFFSVGPAGSDLRVVAYPAGGRH